MTQLPPTTLTHDHATPERGRTLADRLHEGEEFALTFGGQGTDWFATLRELFGEDPDTSRITAARRRVRPPSRARRGATRSRPAASVRAAGMARPRRGAPRRDDLTTASLGLPGVLLAQLATIDLLARGRPGPDPVAPVAAVGHSQGILGVAAFAGRREALNESAGGQRQRRRPGGDRPSHRCRGHHRRPSRRPGRPRRATPPCWPSRAPPSPRSRHSLPRPPTANDVAVVSAVNGPRRVVVSGTPAALRRLRKAIEKRSDTEAAEIEAKVRGGRAFAPTVESVPVALGFHHPALAPAVPMVRDWADACGLDSGLAEHLAHAICVETVDWPRALADAVGPATSWVVDLGPADLSANMTGRALRGRGVTVIPAATETGRDLLFTAGANVREAADWSGYAPASDRPRRRQACRGHQVHPPDRQVADPAGRHDPHHRRPRDRRRRRERRPLGRARRRRPGDRGDLRRERRAGSPSCSTRAGPRRSTPCSSTPTCGTCRSAAAPRPEGAPGRCPVRRPGDQRRHPRGRGRRRHHRGPERGRHHPRGVQAGHRRADPSGAGHRPRGRHHGHRPHRGRRRRRPPLVGGPRRAAARDLPRAAHRPTTSWSASAAASVRRSAASTTSPAAGRSRTARPPCPSTACCIGTAAMATKEATTSADVKKLLVETPASAGPSTAAGSARAAATAASPPAAASSARTSTRSTTPPPAAAPCSTRWPATPRPPLARKDELVAAMDQHQQALLRRRRRDDLRAAAAAVPRAQGGPPGRQAVGSTSPSAPASRTCSTAPVARVHPADLRSDRAHRRRRSGRPRPPRSTRSSRSTRRPARACCTRPTCTSSSRCAVGRASR